MRWTKYEESWFQQVWPKTEIPARAIAHALNRTVSAIQLKARKLGVKRPWTGSPEHLRQLRLAGKEFRTSPEGRKQLRLAGKRGRKIAHGIWNSSPENIERLRQFNSSPDGKKNLKRMQKKVQETYLGSPENLETLKRARKKAGAKPTWPEAIFYGLVYGYDGLAKEFYAQDRIPTTVCDHTVDGRWKDVIFELDGGGHNAHGNMTEHDLLIDAEYQTMGYQVVREETASNLFLRLLQVVRSQS